ncbi:FecR family protein [Janthinobacterium fluminis]|uniref:FecR domain-containing protein n=1 Tax=Janthinobacterium fluminis TaxID=2987524 RepID=A0ABT5JYU5_9BURK|nr:FecR domain-containing protein [Janthinobacterium fluminis]MDC8757656.1 FecR domain-containing protein [Janthinobacterium fluminis]
MNQTPPPVDERAALAAQAWDWLRLLNSGDAVAEDADRFRGWVRSSPAHRTAYNEARRRWDGFRQPAGALLRSDPAVAAFFRPRAQRLPAPGRRAFLGGAVAAAVAGAAVLRPPLGLWPAPAEWGADERTATGEQRALALAGGVTVTLNTRTSVRRQTAGDATVGLELISGEAAVDVRGAAQVFAVVAGAGRSVAGFGQFEVRHLDGRVCVTCLDGSVRVEHPAGVRALRARQQTVYDAHAVGEVSGVDAAAVPAWRSGVLVFNETRLADALDEINRYRPGRVVLMNQAARGQAVSGRFAIAALDLALAQLQHVVGLRARTLPGGLTILS